MKHGRFEWIIELGRVLADRARSLVLRLRGATVGTKVRIGPGCTFHQPGKLALGTRTWLEAGVGVKLVGPDAAAVLGDHVFMARDVHLDISTRLVVGAHTLFGPRCLIVDHNHGTMPERRIDDQGCLAKSIVIGSDVWCGAGVVILPGVVIGDGAVVGANAVVHRDVPPGAVVAGIPATFIRWRDGSRHDA